MSAVLSGLFGALFYAAFILYVVPKYREKVTRGRLYYGWPVAVLASACLLAFLFVLFLLFNSEIIWSSTDRTVASILLLLLFGVGSIVAYADYLKTFGTFDHSMIVFNAPWTGKKSEKWSDLESVDYNGNMEYYVLSFSSGKKIRLSKLLVGHGGVLDIVKENGFEIHE